MARLRHGDRATLPWDSKPNCERVRLHRNPCKASPWLNVPAWCAAAPYGVLAFTSSLISLQTSQIIVVHRTLVKSLRLIQNMIHKTTFGYIWGHFFTDLIHDSQNHIQGMSPANFEMLESAVTGEAGSVPMVNSCCVFW